MATGRRNVAQEGVPFPRPPRSPNALAVMRLARNRPAMLGLSAILLFIVVAALAPLLAPYDPLQMAGEDSLLPPSLGHIFGTDQFGRDVLSRTLYGAHLSLPLGLLPVGFAFLIGVSLGLVAGYADNALRAVIMRLTDVLLGFPVLLLAIFIVAMLGSTPGNMMLAIGIAYIPNYVRLTYAGVLSAKEEEYVQAARAIGCRPARILLYHILPNILAPLIVLSTVNVGWAILTGASLSFLGLGVRPPTPEWGMMVKEGSEYLRNYWWIATFPGLAIMLTVWGINLLGDGLRDALDPRMIA